MIRRSGPDPAHRPDFGAQPKAIEPATVFIHICEHNLVAAQADRLAGDGRLLESFGCLDECPSCGRSPFAFVQGQLIRATTCAALVRKVAAQVARIRRHFPPAP